jgi:hypothetical protein
MVFPHLAQIHVLFKSDYGYVQMLAGSADSRNMGNCREREKERENRSPETLKDKRLKEGIGDKHGVFNWVPTSCSGSRGPSMQHSKCGR